MRIGFPQESRRFLGLVEFNLKLAADAPQQAQNDSHLLLRQQIDLQIKMSALVGLLCHAILGDEYESREENRLERHDHRQQFKRERVEGMPPRIPQYPDEKPYNVENDKCRGAGELGYRVTDAIGCRSVMECLLFEAGDSL